MDAQIKERRDGFLAKAQKLMDQCKAGKLALNTETFQCEEVKTSEPTATKNK